jgi:hypothetical protein
MDKKLKAVDAYLKEGIETRGMDVVYDYGKEYGINDITFNFSAEPTKQPFGDVAFITGYDNDPDYTSTFFMTAEEAMKLGKMLIDTAYDAMNAKRILLEAEACDSRLSFLVLKGLIDKITISRSYEDLDNYEPPYYLYTITVYKNDEELYKYHAVYNLSYFTKESEIKYWIDKLTDKERVKIEFYNWNPYMELEVRRTTAQEEMLKSLSEYNMKLKPTPIKK